MQRKGGAVLVKRHKHIAMKLALLLAIGGGLPVAAYAGGVQTLDTVEVTDSAENLIGSADSSTEGTVTQKELEDTPILRTGELLEAVPGLIISQHSGEGKANQYYLRGINLDHGTDFAISVDGMPVNMPTHAHGQGYSDINFVMPELLSGIQYRKGPYYADEGDFSAVGAAHMDYVNELKQNMGLLTIGTNGYERGVAAASSNLFKGKLLYAVELMHYDGPWQDPDNYKKINGVVRYSQQIGQNDFSVETMAYWGVWHSTNQTADRAIDEDLISRYGTLDTTDQGSSYRYSLSGQWQHTSDNSITKASAYVISYGMDLYNDFTYFLINPGVGDQFHQHDRRIIDGVKVSQTWLSKLFDHDMDNTIGLQVRDDNIAPVALYATDSTDYVATEVQDHVSQTNVALYLQNGFKWAEKFRTVAGVRWDYYHWNVEANLPENSGEVGRSLASPKLSLIFGPWDKTEFFINGGYGYHTNDIRSTTEMVDPTTHLTNTMYPPIERAKGAEIGTRSAIIPHLQNELTLWYLHLDSEQIFDGDHGITTPTFPSYRWGIESANYYSPLTWLTMDADIAYSVPRFIGDPAGSWIPGSPEVVISAGARIDNIKGFLASLQMHYFGSRPLIDNDSVRSNPSTIVNGRVGYKFQDKPFQNWQLLVDVFNIFNTKTSDIDYYYISRLPGEPPAGVNDIQTHPAEPLEVRVTLKLTF
jgi:outer membrane receptor protein involved in Fe transport